MEHAGDLQAPRPRSSREGVGPKEQGGGEFAERGPYLWKQGQTQTRKRLKRYTPASEAQVMNIQDKRSMFQWEGVRPSSVFWYFSAFAVHLLALGISLSEVSLSHRRCVRFLRTEMNLQAASAERSLDQLMVCVCVHEPSGPSWNIGPAGSHLLIAFKSCTFSLRPRVCCSLLVAFVFLILKDESLGWDDLIPWMLMTSKRIRKQR